MAITVQRYTVNGFNLYPYTGSVDSVSYYGYNTTYGASAAFEKQETLATTIHLYEDVTTGKLSIHVIMDAFENANSGSNVNVVISGLPSGASVTVQDDPGDTYVWQDANTLSATFSWGTCCTDGMVIDDIQGFDNLNISVTAVNGVDKFKLASSNGEVEYQDFSVSNTLTISRTPETIDSYLYLEPQPSVYNEAISISTSAGNDVSEVIYTTDGTSPALAKYLAYDNLVPSNPFIAVVEDGRGNVLFDGGFPKWYNAAWDTNWTVFSDMNARFKYLANALDYIANPAKLEQGNKNILIVGDADDGQNYSVKSTAGNGFNTTFSSVCSIMGYTPTYRTKSDYGTQLNMTFSELDNYCAVILMSSVSTSSQLITNSAISELLTYREQGNGILIVTDHGANIASLDDAINTTYSGFFRTANHVAVNFGAYFTGNVNRTSVNVGFLRSEYGDHPLWNNISDSEDIFAGGSESSVVVPETVTYDPQNIPLINLNTDGYHTYKYLLRLSDGSIVTESYTYGLNVAELVNVKNSNNQIVNVLGPTNFRKIDYDFEVIPGDLGSASGLIKKNNLVIGEFAHNGTELDYTFYTYDSKSPYIKSGDSIAIQITSPLEYVKTVPILRNQRDMYDTLSYGKRIGYANKYEWESGISDRELYETSLGSINKSVSFDKHANIEKIHNYMNDADRIPEATALIYDNQVDFDNAIASTVPPTPAQVFAEWGVFAAPSQYYDNISLAPDVTPYNTWTYDEAQDRVIQTANVSPYTGFVSKLPIENYVHEATLTSPNGDDDIIGLVIAHFWDGTNNNILSVDISMGGLIEDTTIMFVNLDYGTSTGEVIESRKYEPVVSNVNGGTGWAGKQVRVRVERDGDIIKILASSINDTTTYNPASEVILDLNADVRLQKFKGPKSYGYSTRSQASSTYIDINFTGGLNYNLISNAQQGITNVYQNGSWKQIGTPIQVVYDYPRIVSNPETGYSFLVTENNIQSYWGSLNTVEVVGGRYPADNGNFFNILNYDNTKSYTITSDFGTITSSNLPQFSLDGLSGVSGTITVTVSDGVDTINVVLYK